MDHEMCTVSKEAYRYAIASDSYHDSGSLRG